ncbi:NAD(P)-dependent alcohol dehydrogenase [Microbulbifer bruguierae]|uniref:NAD(P)-dependent alcohol dehydrogenase n=1 Tax=Microbulbifer bruguierae TaxID=3029061 RepID=A0ABY8NET4_9GAMM|nr:NAD(P)-dependent alcohol dehydrogenase [Microbulbifer bruguierae]WGL17444.1 NAD(P)-dependent alcohol dehydrogenase [Microbulbifer bruguierae]
MKIQAAIARPGAIVDIETCELSAPARSEVRVRLEACGICHTDLLAMGGQLGTPLPAVLGHEGVGIVEALGEGVTGLAPGDRVLMSFGACGGCRACREAAPAYCSSALAMNFAGRRMDGSAPMSLGRAPITSHYFAQSSFATHTIANTHNMVRLDQDLPPELMAPLACGVQTGMSAVLNVLQPDRADRVAIFGCGTVGLAAVMAAAIVGCREIIAVDLNPARTELALALGATAAIVSRDIDLASALKKYGLLNGAVDATGSIPVIETAFRALAQRGQLVCAGVSPAGRNLSIPPRELVFGGRTLRGTVEGDANPKTFIPRMIEYFRAGRLPLDKLVRTYPFSSINRALVDLSSGAVIKPVLMMSDENTY